MPNNQALTMHFLLSMLGVASTIAALRCRQVQCLQSTAGGSSSIHALHKHHVGQRSTALDQTSIPHWYLQPAHGQTKIPSIAQAAERRRGRLLAANEQPRTATDSKEPVRVVNTSYPFSVIGQLSNGCTAFLVGPCHVLTVAHCTYDPQRNIWWPGLEFHPGRNVWNKGVGWQPLGVTSSKDVELSADWQSSGGQPQHDYALIITQRAIGNQLGWLNVTWSSTDTTGRTASGGLDTVDGSSSTRVSSGDAGGQDGSLQQLADVQALPAMLHGAGYPDNKPNGTMWYVTNCSVQDWHYDGEELLWHDCLMRGGDSGAPLWVQLPADPSPQSAQPHALTTSSRGPVPGGPALRMVGMHIGAVPSQAAAQQHGRQGPAPYDPGAKPLAVPFYGQTVEWLRDMMAKHTCSSA